MLRGLLRERLLRGDQERRRQRKQAAKLVIGRSLRHWRGSQRSRYRRCRSLTRIERSGKMAVHLQENSYRAICGAFVLLYCANFPGLAIAGEKPPLMPDQPLALTTTSRISAAIEFALPAIASAIERDVPKRLATIDE